MNIRLLILFSLVLVVFGCKSSTEPEPNYNFLPLSVGSQWSYIGDVPYTRKVIGDTAVNGKIYAVIEQDNFNPNNSPDRYLTKRNYYRKEGNVIYILRPDTMSVLKDFVYVNPSASASGSYYTITSIGDSERRITHVTYSNTRQIFRDTIDGKIYPNVILEHIKTEILFPRTNSIVIEGDYYFADGVGLADQVVSPSGTEELTDYQIK